MTEYPPRVNDATHKRLPCSACYGTGKTTDAAGCRWCSGRGWNYAAQTMQDRNAGRQS